MMISIIIPTLNEAATLPKLFYFIKKNIGGKIPYEIIVCDGGSMDSSVFIAKNNDAKIIHSSIKNRAHQMNLGPQMRMENYYIFYMPILYLQKNLDIPFFPLVTIILQVAVSDYHLTIIIGYFH